VSPAVICPLREVDLLITDDGITDEAVSAFEACGVKVMAV